MRSILIFLVSLCFIPLAVAQVRQNQQCINCEQTKSSQPHLPLRAAASTDVQIAPCSRKLPFTEAEMILELKSKSSKTKQKREILGLKLEDSPELISYLESLITPDSESAFGAAPQSLPDLPSHCTTVLCAAKQIFGDKVGVQLLFMRAKFGLNGSEISYIQGSRFTSSELDDVLLALSDLPPVFFDRDPSPLYRYKRGYKFAPYGQVTVVANAVIQLFDPWSELPKEHRRLEIVHELGHRAGSFESFNESQAWLRLSDWNNRAGNWQSDQAQVSEYGSKNPREDFAESVVAYRYSPERLKKASPEKYALLKNGFFDGLEFIDSHSCLSTNSHTSKEFKQIETKLKPIQLDSPQPENVKVRTLQNCGETILRFLEKRIEEKVETLSQSSFFHDCVVEAAQKEIYESAMNKLQMKSKSTHLALHRKEAYPFQISTAVTESLKQNVIEQVRQDLVQLMSDLLAKAKVISSTDVLNTMSVQVNGSKAGFAKQYHVNEPFFALKLEPVFQNLYRRMSQEIGATPDLAKIQEWVRKWVK